MSVRRLDSVQPAAFSFTPENLSRAKRSIATFPAGKQASAVIQLLWFAQEQDGWVSRPAIEYVGRMLDMAYIRVLEVVTFYTMFNLSPVGRKAHIQVCGTTPCMLRGAEDLIAVCQSKIHIEPFHLNADGSLSWEEVECLGSCVNAPMVQIVKDTYEDLTPESLSKIIDDFQAGRAVKPGPQNGRQFSMALTGATSLTDRSLYDKQRTFKRVEAPPPAVPAPPSNTATVAPTNPASIGAPIAIDLSKKPPLAPVPAAKPVAANDAPALAAKVANALPGPIAGATVQNIDPAVSNKIGLRDTTTGPELLKKPRGKADDLKIIRGVGPVFEKLLNKIGVWHFDQVASWVAADIKHVDDKLVGFHGRIVRDEWVKQAKKLAKVRRPDNAVGDKPEMK